MKHPSQWCSSQHSTDRTLLVLRGSYFWIPLKVLGEKRRPSAKALERPDRAQKHKVIIRLPFSEVKFLKQIPLKRPNLLKWLYINLLKTAPRFSGDSLGKVPFDPKIVNCVQYFGTTCLYIKLSRVTFQYWFILSNCMRLTYVQT